MFDGLVSGRLYKKPVIQRSKSSGARQVKVVLIAKPARGDTVFVTGFTQNEALMGRLIGLDEGDAICLSGEVTTGIYSPENRQASVSNTIWIHGVLTPYHAGRKRKGAEIEGAEYG